MSAAPDAEGVIRLQARRGLAIYFVVLVPLSAAFEALMLWMMVATALSFVFARLRLETGSIWPAITLHASWNSIIQVAFDPASAGAGATLWVGESGNSRYAHGNRHDHYLCSWALDDPQVAGIGERFARGAGLGTDTLRRVPKPSSPVRF